MGFVYPEIKLANAVDDGMSARRLLPPEQARKFPVRALVDSGAQLLCINENLAEQLGLAEFDRKTVELADGSLLTVPIRGPVTIRRLSRKTVANAAILPDDGEDLRGSIPLDDMDRIIDPLKETHLLPSGRPYLARTKIK